MGVFFFSLLVAVIIIFIIGHFGLPEPIDPDGYTDPHPSQIMTGAEPFRFDGSSDVGFLLIHGFEGSPFTLRPLGELLHSHGHTVIGPLLPGHGTSERDFSKTRYQHWYRAVEKVYIKERPRFRKFFLVGFSMGGNLSIKLSTRFANRMPPTGLILLSSPVFLNGIFNGRVIIKDWRLFLSGFIQYFVKFVPKQGEYLAAERISPWVGYGSHYATRTLHSFKANIGKVRPHLHTVRCPVCLIMANNDKTVSNENLHYIFRKISSKEKRAFLFTIDDNLSTRHILMTHHLIRDKVYHYIMKFIQDTLIDFDLKPAERIVIEKKWWQKLFKPGDMEL